MLKLVNSILKDSLNKDTSVVYPIAKISYGEFYDKLSILMLKTEFISSIHKLEKINFELNELKLCAAYFEEFLSSSFFLDLYSINLYLWSSEDKVRSLILLMDDANDSTLSASDYKVFADTVILNFSYNDKRYAAKSAIDSYFSSNVREQKSYHYFPPNA